MTDQPILNSNVGYAELRAGILKPALKIQRVLQLEIPQSDAELQRLEKTMRDFVVGGKALSMQRQGMYFGAAIIAAIYYNIWIAIICLLLSEVAEYLDNIVSNRILLWNGGSVNQAVRFHYLLLFTSTLSSISVALFAFLIADFEAQSAHLTPLFFLFAAGLFAAVNNHQIVSILMVRLVIYGLVFLYIPINDLLIVRPTMDSEYWLNFATVLFVLYFVINCSLIFLRLYQNGLTQLDQIRNERDRAEAALALKSQFVSTVSHELRTPLTSIKGALDLMMSDAFAPMEGPAMKTLDIARRNCDSLGLLVTDLLDIQKIESGQMTYRLQSHDLGCVLSETVELMERFASKGGVELRIVELQENLYVDIDKDRIGQAVRNVLSNAIKFSKSGSNVDISLEANNDNAIISITDFGVGIPEGSKEIVFARFRQIDSSDNRTFSGTGLGMNITDQIMTAHFGSVDYVSVLGQGTTFTLVLPL